MAHDKCIADEMAGKANIEHMGDSANSDAEKVQQVSSRRNVEHNSKRADKCKSCGSMQHGSESCRFKNATCHHYQKKGHIRPICKARLSQMQFNGRSSGKKESKVNSCDSVSDDESVGSCDKHAKDTPKDAAEDVAFGLYRTGTEQLSAESVNRVKPYVGNVQLGKGQINCKMEVGTGASRSTVSKYVYDAELLDYPMDSILSGIKSVMVRVDEILVATSGGITPHMEIIKQVFGRLAKHNVKLNGLKCQFFQAQVTYMGHILSKEGISPVKSKLDAIRLAPRPTNMSQVRSHVTHVKLLLEARQGFFIQNAPTLPTS